MSLIFKQLFERESCTYTYLIADSLTKEAAIIDAVDIMIERDTALLKELELDLKFIIETHIHADHITAASKLKNKTNCTTIMGEHTPSNAVELKVKDNEVIYVDKLEIKVIYTPGHTKDSYSFLMNDYLFSGDTLLINGTGRTDFQGGNSEDSYNSIFNRLLKLPEETLLYPAHDYNGQTVSSIGKEKKFNPRLQVNGINEYIDIMNNLDLSKPKLMDINVASNIKLGAI